MGMVATVDTVDMEGTTTITTMEDTEDMDTITIITDTGTVDTVGAVLPIWKPPSNVTEDMAGMADMADIVVIIMDMDTVVIAGTVDLDIMVKTKACSRIYFMATKITTAL